VKLILDVIKLIPVPIQITIAAIIIGIGVAYAHETRYMTVSDYTKSYVLDLKSAIREIMKELDDPNLTERERIWLEGQLEELIDELCYEKPDDRLCHDS
jgi:hypothetical protein